MAPGSGSHTDELPGNLSWEELKEVASVLSLKAFGVPPHHDELFGKAAAAAWLFVRNCGGPDYVVPGNQAGNVLLFARDVAGGN